MPLIAIGLVLALGSPSAPLLVWSRGAVLGIAAVLVAPRFLAGTEPPMVGVAARAVGAG